ncbi:MAG TPA: hypothetical protein VNY55_01740, partial [Mycobacterium sp.]|nr:hypothetical protein [Mycobacterium sp.]
WEDALYAASVVAWMAKLDEERVIKPLRGYQSTASTKLCEFETLAVPWRSERNETNGMPV